MRRDARAVLMSDVHFNVNTLPLASKALTAALDLAIEYCVPLIIAGDLNDTKAIVRGEVANALIKILKDKGKQTDVFVLIGNHDLLNEKGKEHSLHFLKPYVSEVIDQPGYYSVADDVKGFHFIPYQTETTDFLAAIRKVPKGELVICHQGFLGAAMGEYVVDKSSVPPEAVKHWRVITGHYHKAQDLGTITYIGTPYSITFAEAKDPTKGVRILLDDGTLESVPLNLRKHVILELTTQDIADRTSTTEPPNPGDLVWIKVRGPATELDRLTKKQLVPYIGHQNFKLDKLYAEVKKTSRDTAKLTDEQLIDRLVDMSDESKEEKKQLKALWREIL